MHRQIILIAGPTASGKSALALSLARDLGGVVINADSMQIYRDLAVLTARPGAADLAAAPHALYGVLDGADLSTAARWAAMADRVIAQAWADHQVPILCGGTGLYLKTLLHGIAPVPAIPESARVQARDLHADLGGPNFRAALAVLDPAAAARLHPGDRQRLIRAYEVVLATGRTLDDWHRAEPPAALRYRCFTVTLLPPRAALYQAIDARFAAMPGQGALDEVAALSARGLAPDLPILKAVGFRELQAYLAGDVSLEAAIEAAQRASRQYAKRQFTWFRHQLAADVLVEAKYSINLAQEICQKIRNWA